MNPPVLLLLALLGAVLPGPLSAGCSGDRPLIAIDVGHDRERFGSKSARGRPEWSFNAALAQPVAAALVSAGFDARVVNPDGEKLPLRERAHSAGALGAALLISLHHDSVQPQYLEEWQVEGRALRYSDRFNGFSLFVSQRNAHYDASTAFGRTLGNTLAARGFTPTLHHAEPIPGENRPLIDPALGLYRFDDLIVLHSAPAPALLLEAGVIVNREEELSVQTPEFRGRVAQAVADAVRAWCGKRNEAAAPRGPGDPS